MANLGFYRHVLRQKKVLKRRTTQITLGCPRLNAFSVDQGYSLVGCSPAEPTSAYPDVINVIPTNYLTKKSYPHFLVFR